MIDFEKLTKSDWIQLVQRELKGAPYESLIWKINERISVDPYYTKEEIDVVIPPIPFNPEWYIGESFDLAEENINATLLKSLEGGVNSPSFKISKDFTEEELDIVFEGIEFSYLFNFIEFPDGVSEETVFNTLDLICENSGVEHEQLFGCVSMPPAIRDETFFDIEEIYHSLYLLGFSCDSTTQDVDISLANLLTEMKTSFENVESYEILDVFRSCFFNFEIGKNYLFEIARLRAFSILWANFQKSYNIDHIQVPLINVAFDPSAYTEDVNLNMIRATTMTMSAVIGGASRITVLPSDINGSDFSRRIARNVHHLLAMESHFDKVIDPAAGSYYIDTLTKKIAESAWEIFVNS